jgi:hypothetical protein
MIAGNSVDTVDTEPSLTQVTQGPEAVTICLCDQWGTCLQGIVFISKEGSWLQYTERNLKFSQTLGKSVSTLHTHLTKMWMRCFLQSFLQDPIPPFLSSHFLLGVPYTPGARMPPLSGSSKHTKALQKQNPSQEITGKLPETETQWEYTYCSWTTHFKVVQWKILCGFHN